MKEKENRPHMEKSEGAGKNGLGFSARTDYPVQRLPDTEMLKEKAGEVFKTDTSDLDIELNSPEPSKIGAVATAQGKRVKIAPSHSDMRKKENVKVAGHEIKHTEQQAKGMVKPTGMINGVPVNTRKDLESDADRGGDALANAL